MAEIAVLHLQCAKNRAVSSKLELAAARATRNISLNQINPTILKIFEKSFYQIRHHIAKLSEKFRFPSTELRNAKRVLFFYRM